jgi:signal transduction histidine kinase
MDPHRALPAVWHVILSRDGTVLNADGAPTSWIGTSIERQNVPDDFKEAVRALLRRSNHAGAPVWTNIPLASIEQRVSLTVVDALPLHRVSTDLRMILHSSLDALVRQATACDVTIAVAIDDKLPQFVLIDADKLMWAITTLVGNALRYVRHGSRIMPGGSIGVRASYAVDDSAVVFEVHDDGPGIPRERVKQLFTDHARVGLALGMVREVVVAHGGTVDVHSDTDTFRHGTTIRLTLPVA